ncbi:glutathione transferase Ure2p class [Trametes sanguinea]|nr:glutathione transferase Ure2p class [Trametes sanguinea]
MSSNKQFTLYTTNGAPPNGWKVMIVLEELGLSYEHKFLDFSKGEQKSPEYTKYNPNGRIPALIDHRANDFVIWESNAIISYLVEQYDPEHKISFDRFEDKIIQLQWLFFQASGQGPYFGQAGWFALFHPEKVPSAIERYQKEILRVFGVLEGVLSKQAWLVGDKCSVADMSFITWTDAAITWPLVKEGFNFEAEFPAVAKWHGAMTNRDSVKKVFAIRKATSA